MDDDLICNLLFLCVLIAIWVFVIQDAVKPYKKAEPLDSGTIYEMQEIPAHTEIPVNHNGYLVYDDAYVISYQKTVDGELKQDQWYVDKETYEKYRVGDWFVYDPAYCSSDCSWTRINGQNYVNYALRAAMISSSMAAS